jgi:HSP20 family protein
MILRGLNAPWWNVRHPFEELERMKSQMEKLFQGYNRRAGAGVFPLINISEDKDAYRVRAELPGLQADDLDISVTDNKLAITGERKITEESKAAKYHRREREAGKFSRLISLPGQIDAAKIEAKLADGLLTVVLPKAEEAKPRKINVK